MKKYIELSETTKALDKYNVCGYMQEVPFSEVLETLESLTAVDVVEVVRCKDCEEYHVRTNWCDRNEKYENPKHFCGSGKKGNEEAVEDYYER